MHERGDGDEGKCLLQMCGNNSVYDHRIKQTAAML